METPGPIPPTPTRAATRDDPFLDKNTILTAFRGKSPFSFAGSDKYDEGKLFLERFSGELECSADPGIQSLLSTPAGAVPQQWLQATYQALLQLTTDAAVKIVQQHPKDGAAAFRALRRAVYQTTSTSVLSQLKASLHAFMPSGIPTDRDPTGALNRLMALQREIAALTTYDANAQLADMECALPESYAVPVATQPANSNTTVLFSSVVNHYTRYLATLAGTSEEQEITAAAIGRPHDARTFAGGQQRRPPKDGCHLCGGAHWLHACPYKADAVAHVRAALAAQGAQAAAVTGGCADTQGSADGAAPPTVAAVAAPGEFVTPLGVIRPAPANCQVGLPSAGAVALPDEDNPAYSGFVDIAC